MNFRHLCFFVWSLVGLVLPGLNAAVTAQPYVYRSQLQTEPGTSRYILVSDIEVVDLATGQIVFTESLAGGLSVRNDLDTWFGDIDVPSERAYLYRREYDVDGFVVEYYVGLDVGVEGAIFQPPPGTGIATHILEAPEVGRVYFVYQNTDVEEDEGYANNGLAAAFDRVTGQHLFTFRAYDVGRDFSSDRIFLSDDGAIFYAEGHGPDGEGRLLDAHFRAFDAATGAPLGETVCTPSVLLATNLSTRDGAAGNGLLTYVPENGRPTLAVCDAATGEIISEIQHASAVNALREDAERAEGWTVQYPFGMPDSERLSVDGRRVISSVFRPIGDGSLRQPAYARTGDLLIYEASTGELIQWVRTDEEARTLLFADFPETVFLALVEPDPQSDHSVLISVQEAASADLTIIETASELLYDLADFARREGGTEGEDAAIAAEDAALALDERNVADAREALNRLADVLGTMSGRLGAIVTAASSAVVERAEEALAELSDLTNLPAAATLASLSVEASFSGNSFLVSGLDHDLSGNATGSGDDRHGIAAADEAARQSILDALSSNQEGNVTGQDPAPDIAVAAPGLDVEALVDLLLARADLITLDADPGNQTVGTATEPVVAYAPDGLDVQGTFEGFGILVVEGTFEEAAELRGNAAWTGLVIVRGVDGAQAAFDMSGSVEVLGAVVLSSDTGAVLDVGGSSSIRYSAEALQLAQSLLDAP